MKSAKKTGHKQTGLLIAFEGIDGTGKSTQIRLLAKELNRLGLVTISTREPTDGPIGLRIRKLYVNRADVSPKEELALFMADRKQHVTEVILPALASGKIVLTDRYYLSTAAYQGAAGLDPEDIMKRNEVFAPKPDLALILVVPPRFGIERIQTLRGEDLNDFEQETELLKVAAVFDGLNRSFIRRIDGAGSIEEVHNQVMHQVKQLLRKREKGGSRADCQVRE